MNVTIPSSVTSICEGAFESCKSLKEICIPETVKYIKNSAFFELTAVIIPNSITSIGIEAFFRCKSLKSVKLSNALITIDVSVFEECKNFKKIYSFDG